MPPSATKTGIQAADILSHYAFGSIRLISKLGSFSPEYVFNKIRGQEDQLERELGVLWQETRIRSEPDPSDDDWDLSEQAYDYERFYWVGERWGYMKLRRYPVRSIQRMAFSFPNPDMTVFNVPLSWIRLDGDFGTIRVVPDRDAVLALFSGFMLSLFSGGRAIPASISVDYTAGFRAGTGSAEDSLYEHHADLLEHLKQSVVADILMDAFMPGSLSVSSDGQSQSMSLDVKNFLESHQRQRARLRDRLKGVMMTVV